MERPLHLTSVTLKGQIEGHSDFEALYLAKEQLGHILLLNINRKGYMGSPLMQLHLTSVTLKCRCQCHSDFER